MTKTLSCRYIHHALYLGPDQFRHCCKRFHVDGEMRGDAVVFSVDSDDDVGPDKVLAAKRELWRAINAGETTQCSGCPYLSEAEWPELDRLSLDLISVEAHSRCNMRCSYCSDIYYGNVLPKYDVMALFDRYAEAGSIGDEVVLAWGGGEPLMLDGFEKIFATVSRRLKPLYNRVFSNAILYSQELADHLKDGRAILTTSIDAGTVETFRQVRGVNQLYKVLGNLRRYVEFAGTANIALKYIFTDGNSTMAEVEEFLARIQEHGLSHCAFQISADYKSAEIGAEQVKSAVRLYEGLLQGGTASCHFDDHLRPRINHAIRVIRASDPAALADLSILANNDRFRGQPVVVWGSGEYADGLIRESLFFEESPIAFFVDSDPAKQGGTFHNAPIKAPDAVLTVDHPVVIGSSYAYQDIRRALHAMGVADQRIVDSMIF